MKTIFYHVLYKNIRILFSCSYNECYLSNNNDQRFFDFKITINYYTADTMICVNTLFYYILLEYEPKPMFPLH